MTDSSTLVSPAPAPPSNSAQSEVSTDSQQTSQTAVESGDTTIAPTQPSQSQPPQSIHTRPVMEPRQDSGTMIVPADHPEIELKHEVYGPNDARSFSPRRGIEDTQKMLGGKRSLLKRCAYACSSLDIQIFY